MSFRFLIPFVKNEVIILGFAPWDWRMLIYSPLRHRNKVIYHTSWPYWDELATPRQYGPLNGLLRRYWLKTLQHPNVEIVTVLSAASEDLYAKLNLRSVIIPHAVPATFFRARKDHIENFDTPDRPLKILYVGELSTKKGLKLLIDIIDRNEDHGFVLTTVGDGPLRALIEQKAKQKPKQFTNMGPIYDRERLAAVMEDHDLLALFSQHQDGWEELFGIVIVEASACGLAVLSTNHIGPRSIFKDAPSSFLVESSDHREIEQRLLQFSKSPQKLKENRQITRGIAKNYKSSVIRKLWFRIIRGKI
jgi:glycosyltransferase involved in cell wall biosynthesis